MICVTPNTHLLLIISSQVHACAHPYLYISAGLRFMAAGQSPRTSEQPLPLAQPTCHVRHARPACPACTAVCLRLQWMMINRLLRIMWPKLTESIFKTVIGVVKPIVQDLLNKVCSTSITLCREC
jgi:hypothetical protein